MNKIKALYINELIKISKKTSILIMLIIMALGVFGLGGLLKFQNNMSNNYRPPAGEEQKWMTDEMKFQMEMMEQELEQLQNNLSGIDPEADAAQYSMIQEQIAATEDRISIYQLAIDENISLISGETYLSRSLYAIPEARREIRALEQVPEDGRDSEWEDNYQYWQDSLAEYEQIVRQKDFAAYISMESARFADDPSLTPEEISIEQERLAQWYKLDPSGGTDSSINTYSVQQVLAQFASLKKSLATNLDYTGQGGLLPLEPDYRSELENQLAVLEYKMDNNLIELDYSDSLPISALGTIYSFGTFMVVLLALILAGSAVSQEIATGSIKSLIISPAKRWKIFTAKIMSLISVCLAAALLLYGLGMLSNGIFFGFSAAKPYVYANQGVAREMSFAVFNLLGMAVRLIDILVFMFLALMLSVLTRNTAAAVGISMAAFFGNNIVQPIMMFLPKAEWVKFIPYININLLDRFFPYQDQSMLSGFASMGMNIVRPGLTFSLIYLAVICICMVYTALDSFNRRDIK